MSEKYSGYRAQLRDRASFCSVLLVFAVVLTCVMSLPMAAEVQAQELAIPPLRVIFLEGNGQSEGTPIELPRETLQQIQVTGGTVYLSSDLWDEPQDSSLVPASLDPSLYGRAAELAMGLPAPLPENSVLIDFDSAFNDATIETLLPGRTLLAYQANDGMAYTTEYLYPLNPGEFRLQQLFAHITRDEITEDQLYLYYSPSDGTEVGEEVEEEADVEDAAKGDELVTTSEESNSSAELNTGTELSDPALGTETPTQSEANPSQPVTPAESAKSEASEEPPTPEAEISPSEPSEEQTEEITADPTTTNPDLITVLSKSPEEQLQEDLKAQLAGLILPQTKEEASQTVPRNAATQPSTSTAPTPSNDTDPVEIVELQGEELERVMVRATPEVLDDASEANDTDDLQKTTETGTPDSSEVADETGNEEFLGAMYASDNKLNQRFQTLAEATYTLEGYLPGLPEKNAFAARVQQRRIEELLEELEQQVSTQEQRELYHHAEVILKQSEQKLQINSTVVIVGETGESLHEPLILGGSLLGLALLVTFVARRKRRQF